MQTRTSVALLLLTASVALNTRAAQSDYSDPKMNAGEQPASRIPTRRRRWMPLPDGRKWALHGRRRRGPGA